MTSLEESFFYLLSNKETKRDFSLVSISLNYNFFKGKYQEILSFETQSDLISRSCLRGEKKDKCFHTKFCKYILGLQGHTSPKNPKLRLELILNYG